MEGERKETNSIGSNKDGDKDDIAKEEKDRADENGKKEKKENDKETEIDEFFKVMK